MQQKTDRSPGGVEKTQATGGSRQSANPGRGRAGASKAAVERGEEAQDLAAVVPEGKQPDEAKKGKYQIKFLTDIDARNRATLAGQTQYSSNSATTQAWTAETPQSHPPELIGITHERWFLIIKRYAIWNESMGQYMLG